ncbi:MAG: ATP-binding protein [Nitrososphaerales archaeon]
MADVVLGFQIPTGDPVSVELTHIVVTGLTNKTGKTTLIEGILSRAENYRSLVILTKPGEKVFAEYHRVVPYLQKRSDWRYIRDLIESSEKRKFRFEEWNIKRASENTHSLEEFRDRCLELAKVKDSKEPNANQRTYAMLADYVDALLQGMQNFEFSKTFPRLAKGISVMDLTSIRDDDVKAIIIASVLDYVRLNEKDLIVCVPELSIFDPQERHAPIKEPLERLIKQGASNGVFVIMDTQDMANVDKQPLKQCYTWILGLQTERNEVKHVLDQLHSNPKPSANDIMTLGLGEFFVSTPRESKKFYAQPAWMSPKAAELVARGSMRKQVAAQYAWESPKQTTLPEIAPATQIAPVTQSSPLTLSASPEPAPKVLTVDKTVSTLEVPKTQDTFELLEQLEPRSMLGKVCIVLKNGNSSNDNSKWTASKVQSGLKAHGWDDSGYEDAINYLVREEILKEKGNGRLSFDTRRVVVKENKRTVSIS